MPVRRRRLRRAGLACAVVLLCAAALSAPVLRRAGELLVVDEPIGPSDAIVIAVDASAVGVPEAVALVNRGIAPRVAVFGTPPGDEYVESAADANSPKDDADRAVRNLRALHVEVERIDRAISGTTEEGRALLDWCVRRGYRRVVVVTRPDHARRVRRVLDRSVPEGTLSVAVRYARGSDFDPERWWHTPRGIYIAAAELAKLGGDVVLQAFTRLPRPRRLRE